jgi:sulfite reductase beta subunit-like hemoprotein
LLSFIKRDALPELAAALGNLSVDVLARKPLASFVSCAGASTCRLGLCLSRNAARAGAEALEQGGIPQETLANLDPLC